MPQVATQEQLCLIQEFETDGGTSFGRESEGTCREQSLVLKGNVLHEPFAYKHYDTWRYALHLVN